MTRRIHGSPIAGLGLVPLLLLSACRMMSGPDAAYQETGKREPWYTMMRPARSEPAAQLAYARSLAADGRVTRAARQFRALVASWPAAPEAPAGQLDYARMLERRKSWAAAFDAYEQLAKRYPGQAPYGEIVDRQFDLAIRQMNHRRWPLLFGGFRSPGAAIPMFRAIVDHAPRGAHAAEALRLMAQAQEEDGRPEEAAQAYGEILSLYPSSPGAETAAFGRARCIARLSSGAPNDMLLAQDAWVACAAALREFPGSALAAAAREQQGRAYRLLARTAYEKALYYDRTARRYAAARVHYELILKNYAGSEWADAARRRLASLPPEKGPDEAVTN